MSAGTPGVGSIVPLGPSTTWIDPWSPGRPWTYPVAPYAPSVTVSANVEWRPRPFRGWDTEDLEELARVAAAKGKWATVETVAHELAQRPAERGEA